jgi:phenylpropionate dioxygenase-like ring-hydroxylating dioxygenase large terminal subunit
MEQELAPGLPAGLPLGLRNYWYPVLQSEELPPEKPVGFRALGENLVAWRDTQGKPNVVIDRCSHRSMKLSAGRVLDGELQCALHGLRFDGKGKCVLIPWQEEETREVSRVHDRMAIKAYPADELGGYVWAFIGGNSPPPVSSEVPEELSKPDEFILFRLPTQVWNANWLIAVDGSDGFHAVTLHAGSQTQAQAGGGVPLKDRRVKIVRTSHGVRGVSVDLAGNRITHGHFTVDVKGDRFTLPCLTSNPILPAPGVPPYAARLWQYPQDEKHTLVVRYLAWRARTEEERSVARKTFEGVAKARLERVAAEDAAAAEAQGDLVEARLHENLLGPDADVIKVRNLLNEAYRSPARVPINPQSLLFPL